MGHGLMSSVNAAFAAGVIKEVHFYPGLTSLERTDASHSLYLSVFFVRFVAVPLRDVRFTMINDFNHFQGVVETVASSQRSLQTDKRT